MLGLIAIVIIIIITVVHRQSTNGATNEHTTKIASKLDSLWKIAQDSLKDKKYLRAEKALLTILRADKRNATAYNRLGILYAKQQVFSDAIECFEIAQSLEPNPSSLHNVGLIYLEVGKLDKAALAFEQAISMEEDVPSRYVAYAKVQEKRGDIKKMISSLEKAAELERNPQTLRILADAHKGQGNEERYTELSKELNSILTPKKKPKVSVVKRIKQPRKVI